jgi:hypothetical protein
MNFQYTIDDLKSLFDYLKNNPDSTFDNWVEFNSKILTEEEEGIFRFIEMCNFKIPLGEKEYDFFLINWNGVGGGHFRDGFKIFERKYFGDNKYELHNNHYGEHNLLTTDKDFFVDIENWEDGEYKKSKQLKCKINDADIIISCDLFMDDDNEIDKYNIWENQMQRNNFHFWTINDIDIYINNIKYLDYKPVLQLFNK